MLWAARKVTQLVRNSRGSWITGWMGDMMSTWDLTPLEGSCNRDKGIGPPRTVFASSCSIASLGDRVSVESRRTARRHLGLGESGSFAPARQGFAGSLGESWRVHALGAARVASVRRAGLSSGPLGQIRSLGASEGRMEGEGKSLGERLKGFEGGGGVSVFHPGISG